MKELFIGIDDFQKFQQNNSYYVDKSLFIREMVDLRRCTLSAIRTLSIKLLLSCEKHCALYGFQQDVQMKRAK